VSTEEENKAIFRRYIEEVWNQTNLEVVDEIFDRYLSHQPDGSVLERGPEDVKHFVSEVRASAGRPRSPSSSSGRVCCRMTSCRRARTVTCAR
jgi:hypothetical protein